MSRTGLLSEDEDEDWGDEQENIDDTYLTFSLGRETYAVGIANVTEIVGFQQVTPVPDVPEFVKGVINLRGKIIPVIDVRLRFGMEAVPYSERTVIIVLDVKGSFSGLVVDRVNDVLEIPAAAVELATQWHGSRGTRSVVRGMGRTEGVVCIVLDVDALLQEGEIHLPGNLTGPAPPPRTPAPNASASPAQDPEERA